MVENAKKPEIVESSKKTETKDPTKKFTYSLPESVDLKIDELAKQYGTNKSQIVQVGTLLLHYVSQEVNGDDKLQIKKKDGSIETLKFMPYI